jgi:hypothetical protein
MSFSLSGSEELFIFIVAKLAALMRVTWQPITRQL